MTNKTKTVEWEKRLEKLAFKVPSWSNNILRIEDVNRFISSLLQKQADRFVELGEGLKKYENGIFGIVQVKKNDYNQAISDLQEAIKNDKVLEAEGSVIGNNILMTHEDYKKVIDLAQEDKRKRIIEIIKEMKVDIYTNTGYGLPELMDISNKNLIIDDILQRIKEME